MTTTAEESVVKKISIILAACCALVAAAPPARAQDETEKAIEKYRQMLKEDPWSNPGLLDADRGEGLWKTPAGPNKVTLEKCDLGKGAGVVDGAFAELPRYFADAGKVMDLETRLMWCMEKLQGVKHADLVKQPYPAGGQPVKDLGAIATYVASKSSGMKYAAKLDQPQEKAVVDEGHAIFFRRQGPHDFACATCHNESGKRIRLQGLPYPRRSEGSQAGRRPVAGLSRLDHAGDDDAAPALRLLLADAHAGAGDRIGRERGADRLSRRRTPRAARSPPPA